MAHPNLTPLKTACLLLMLGMGMGSVSLALPPGTGGPGEPPVPGEPPTDPDSDCNDRVTGNLGATPATIQSGQQSTLSWSVTIPPDCTALGEVTLSSRRVDLEGQLSVSPMADQPYHLRLGTQTLATVTVRVELPSVVHINGNTAEWRRLLLQAVGTPNRKVNLGPQVDMDMSGFWHIPIAEGVTLTSESLPLFETMRTAAALDRAIVPRFPSATIPNRDARSLGPRLYTRTNSQRRALFETVGGQVRIRNFRLEGPQLGVAKGDGKLERGILVNYRIDRPIEISNMEFSGWGGTAIYVKADTSEQRARPFENVWIHDNFFHHNQHEGGDGYGVEVKHNSHALIERNVFDFNRHAIAAGGEDGTGYLARLNLVLKGGGLHQCVAGICFDTHQFDVHGTETCYLDGLFKPLSCGQAGEQFVMSRNAFQYTAHYAIKVRGNPTASALVSENVFAHSSQGQAVLQNGNKGVGDNITNPIQFSGNQYGIDTYGRYGVCDFDGDGKDDLFQASGAQWWYMSGANMHWVFLQANTERLEQLGLGDFDGDRRCDVFSVHGGNFFGIYPSGTGPWRELGNQPGAPRSQLAFGDFNGDGVTDIFRRAPDGQWWIVSPGRYDWTPVQGDTLPLTQLRFGDFDGDRVTDVIAVVNGHWSISSGARQPWQPLNQGLSTGLEKLLIGDLDGNGFDDIIGYSGGGTWKVSWDGRGGWQTLGKMEGLNEVLVHGFIGRFTGAGPMDLVAVGFSTRIGQRLDRANARFVPYSRFAY